MEEKNFCEKCGSKLENGKCPNCDINEEIQLKRKDKNVLFIILDIVRYIIGTFFIIGNLTDLPNVYGYVGILFGISFYPYLYRKVLPSLFKGITQKKIRICEIVLPILMLVSWVISLQSYNYEDSNDNFYSDDYNNNYNDNQNDDNVVKEETLEEKIRKNIVLNLDSSEELDSIKLNTEINKYDVNIKYKKDSLNAYICASDTQYFAKKYINNENINSIQFECINNTGTINYVKVENVFSITENTIESNTKYFDANFNSLNTNLTQLKENQIKEYKNSCGTYNYKDVLRNPYNYLGKRAYWFGEVVQVVSKTSYSSTFRINVSCEKLTYYNDYICRDTIYVNYIGDDSFIEDDYVKLWGTLEGTQTYTTVLGASVTIPKFNAMYIELQ